MNHQEIIKTDESHYGKSEKAEVNVNVTLAPERVDPYYFIKYFFKSSRNR